MPQPYVTIGPWTVQTYTLALAVGILASAGIGFYRARPVRRVAAVADVYLGGLVGGVLLARVVHVLLNWNYFADNRDEAFRLSAGGLDWHGAVIGALAGMGAVWWIHRRRDAEDLATPYPYGDLVDALTPALPLMALVGWFGCWAASCAYGAEVATLADYPPLLVWYGPDIFGLYAPRFNTQALGMVWSAFVLLIALAAFIAQGLKYRRFWLVLALFSAGMFALGFVRGDYAARLDGLRLDQWLDLGLLAYGAWRLAFSFRRSEQMV